MCVFNFRVFMALQTTMALRGTTVGMLLVSLFDLPTRRESGRVQYRSSDVVERLDRWFRLGSGICSERGDSALWAGMD